MTAIRQVTGMAYDDKTKKMQIKKLTVRVTHDKAGSTISIEDGKTMLSVPLEPIEGMLKKGKRQ
ncbi:hypothetical protein OBO34_19450 [Clostridiales Family XIII bacterium ASD5510]|uniref:Uncharacterized protein n=1 Tax=Hominibacterium faecale TaxID=2839743 RepID=A0A9J6QYA1_9FIRM|nr:hypothetical protein [Hominibacterium faecale]MCU7380491.1 hypothetical protein [Hominibacterium faecale]